MGNRLDLRGQRFNSWVVISDAGRAKSGAVLWYCKCDCGTYGTVPSDTLRSGKSRSCGCQKKISDEEMIGKKFRRLLVIERGPVEGEQLTWQCQCNCGNIVFVRSGNLRSGNSGSCGCGIAFKHGMSDTPEYSVWSGIKGRCLAPKNNSYRYYGGRGIKIYEPWIYSFEEFYKHVGKKPGPEYSLDRINCDGHYEPGNVKWATPIEQWENRKSRGMTFGYYQHETRKTAIYPSEICVDAVIYCTLGLSSEASEVCSKVKKAIRDNGFELTAEVKKNIIDEMGDTMWYLSELANSLDIPLETIAKRNLDKLASRKERGVLGGSGDNR